MDIKGEVSIFGGAVMVLALVKGFYPNKEVKPGLMLWLEDFFQK